MSWKQHAKYTPVAHREPCDTDKENPIGDGYFQHGRRFPSLSWLGGITALAVFAFGIAITIILHPSARPKILCTNPALRKEWRMVSRQEQAAYIAAALCLHSKPSLLSWDSEAKRSDDFPWMHAQNPPNHHRTPNFLPWHRYFIHLYEKALQEECGYRGYLLYWDWTLDHQNLSHAPVFDAEHGFGGDGGLEGEDSLFGGSCILDRPFSTYEVRVLGNESKPHCLSRGFGRAVKGSFSGKTISPDAISEVLQEEHYYDFMTQLEAHADNDLPMGIGGDWVLASAPNDPLFYLHHTQVDRLWWNWQQQDHRRRVFQYSGPESGLESTSPSHTPSLEDLLPPPLGDGIKIRDLMSTETDLLCYGY